MQNKLEVNHFADLNNPVIDDVFNDDEFKQLRSLQ